MPNRLPPLVGRDEAVKAEFVLLPVAEAPNKPPLGAAFAVLLEAAEAMPQSNELTGTADSQTSNAPLTDLHHRLIEEEESPLHFTSFVISDYRKRTQWLNPLC